LQITYIYRNVTQGPRAKSNWKEVKIGLEVSRQRLDNKAVPGYFEHIFFIEGYLVISCFRLIFFINKALLEELGDINITLETK